MLDLCTIKFNIPELKEKLLSTGDFHLEETNYVGFIITLYIIKYLLQ